MELEYWENKHSEAFSDISKSLENINGIFVAYNSNIDAIKHIEKKDIAKLLKHVNLENVKHRSMSFPRVIKDPDDLLARLIIAMRDGKAAEVPTYSTDIHEWLTDHINFDNSYMGGQTGIISNFLANIGIKKVITYVPWLSKEQAEYFVNSGNLFYPIVENGKLVLKHPMDAYKSEYEPKVNWILEFSKGLDVEYDEEEFVVPRDNRLIISSRPIWLRIDMGKELYDHLPVLGKSVDGAVLSGYQMIKEEYDDGSTYLDYVTKSVKAIRKLKEGNPNIRIHVEFTSIQNKFIRERILKDIVRQEVHSLGLDTIEVANALNVLDYEELAYAVINKTEKGISALYEGAVRLLYELELDRVHVHALGYFICVVTKDHPVDTEEHRNALLFASTASAAKAKLGNIESIDDIKTGLETPISEDGHDHLKSLGKYLAREGICQSEDCEKGYVRTPEHDVIIIPTKVVDNPVATVGIGDVISAASFAAILAKMK
ncbi:MAG: ADP-specific phosphofructokinase [Methanohalobium sp.]|uniref:ADP-specific phosphofructokinase n=1 Tax=Methanohalobium sp. TaxID=2837493 RepID=UPI003979AF6E